MNRKEIPKPTHKAKKPTGKSAVGNLPINERQAKNIKGGAVRIK